MHLQQPLHLPLRACPHPPPLRNLSHLCLLPLPACWPLPVPRPLPQLPILLPPRVPLLRPPLLPLLCRNWKPPQPDWDIRQDKEWQAPDAEIRQNRQAAFSPMPRPHPAAPGVYFPRAGVLPLMPEPCLPVQALPIRQLPIPMCLSILLLLHLWVFLPLLHILQHSCARRPPVLRLQPAKICRTRIPMIPNPALPPPVAAAGMFALRLQNPSSLPHLHLLWFPLPLLPLQPRPVLQLVQSKARAKRVLPHFHHPGNPSRHLPLRHSCLPVNLPPQPPPLCRPTRQPPVRPPLHPRAGHRLPIQPKRPPCSPPTSPNPRWPMRCISRLRGVCTRGSMRYIPWGA